MTVINLNPRGIGRGGGYPSLATGKQCDFGHDLSMFASSRADAYTFADWIAIDVDDGRGRTKRVDRCYIDYRPSEPQWLQIKVCAEEENEATLDRLYTVLNVQGGYIDEATVKWVLDPENNRQPYGFRIYDQLAKTALVPTDRYIAGLPEGPRYFEATPEEREAIVELAKAQDLSPNAVMRQALRGYQMDHHRRMAGETVTWSGDEQRAREFSGRTEENVRAELLSGEGDLWRVDYVDSDAHEEKLSIDVRAVDKQAASKRVLDMLTADNDDHKLFFKTPREIYFEVDMVAIEKLEEA